MAVPAAEADQLAAERAPDQVAGAAHPPAGHLRVRQVAPRGESGPTVVSAGRLKASDEQFTRVAFPHRAQLLTEYRQGCRVPAGRSAQRQYRALAILLVDGLSYLLFAGSLLAVGSRLAPLADTGGGPGPAAVGPGPRIGYRQVVTDRALLGALLVNSLFMVFALSPGNTAYPAWVTGDGGGSTRVVGFGFALNIMVLLIIQLFGIRWSRGRERTRVAACASLFFAAAWLMIVAPVSLGLPGTSRDVVFVLALGVFALGEALLSPTLPAVINDLAPDHLRGRYNAVFSLSNQVGPVAAPAISGAALGYGYGEPYLYGLTACCLLIGALALSLGRITPRAPGTNASPLRLREDGCPAPTDPRARRTPARPVRRRSQDMSEQQGYQASSTTRSSPPCGRPTGRRPRG